MEHSSVMNDSPRLTHINWYCIYVHPKYKRSKNYAKDTDHTLLRTQIAYNKSGKGFTSPVKKKSNKIKKIRAYA